MASSTASAPVKAFSTGRIVFLAVVGALGGFLFGYDSAVVNGATAAIQYRFHVDSTLLGVVVAIALVGCAIGAWFAGRLADRFGRKKVALTAAVLFLIAGFGQGFPTGTADFMGWRLLGGFAIGVASVAAPMYISEISPTHLRGRLTALFQFAIVIGIFATGIGNYLLLKLAGTPESVKAGTQFVDGKSFPSCPDVMSLSGTGSATSPFMCSAPESTGALWGLTAWQWMFLLMAIPAAIYFLLTLVVPESPRYLVQAGKTEQARVVIGELMGGDADAHLAEIQATVSSDHPPRMSDLRGHRFGLMPIVWIAIILNLFQQFVGINAVIYYSNLVYAAVGLGQSSAFLTSMITTGVNLVFTIVAIVMIDRIGRKRLLLIGSVGMAVSLAVIAIIFGTAGKCTATLIGDTINGCDVPADVGQPLLSPGAGMIAIIGVNVFIAFFAATWGPVVWVLIAEMFPNRIRAAGLAVGAMAQWIGNLVVSTAFPGMASLSIALTYGIFTIFAILSFWFVAKKVKETKGISLEKMGELEAAELG